MGKPACHFFGYAVTDSYFIAKKELRTNSLSAAAPNLPAIRKVCVKPKCDRPTKQIQSKHIVIVKVLHNILNTAMKNITQPINSVDLHIPVMSQPV